MMLSILSKLCPCGGVCRGKSEKEGEGEEMEEPARIHFQRPKGCDV